METTRVSEYNPRLMDIRVGNKYRIGRKIGGGSFGEIYRGKFFKDRKKKKKKDLNVIFIWIFFFIFYFDLLEVSIKVFLLLFI